MTSSFSAPKSLSAPPSCAWNWSRSVSPRRFAIPPQDIQVLSPMHRGAAGVTTLNETIQQALNPPQPDKTERSLGSRIYRTGDRVMQVRNNYDKDVFNGDMAILKK